MKWTIVLLALVASMGDTARVKNNEGKDADVEQALETVNKEEMTALAGEADKDRATMPYLNVLVDKDQHPLVDRYVDKEAIFGSEVSKPPQLLDRVVVRRGAPFSVEVMHFDSSFAPTPLTPPSQFHLFYSFVKCQEQKEGEVKLPAPGSDRTEWEAYYKWKKQKEGEVKLLECKPEEERDGKFSLANVHLATSTTPTFKVTLPNNIPIGNFNLTVRGDKDDLASKPLASKIIIVLFNPFTCVDCDEYAGNVEEEEEYAGNVTSMQEKSLLDFEKEYVGGDTGLIWQGSAQNNAPMFWTYEPFRAANLLISIALLEEPLLDPLERGSPTLVSRHLSHAIGKRVCSGRWMPPYACSEKWPNSCSSPSDWTSSSDILEQHWANDGLVKWCQCWVFAGVTTTVGRALGLGTRVVTTFNSAHDSNNDRSISKFFFIDKEGRYEIAESDDLKCPGWCRSGKEDGQDKMCNPELCGKEIRLGMGFKEKEECSGCHQCFACKHKEDSVWNFHVWNDIFFKRADIDNGDGWQAIDATPQEESYFKFQMGPASVRNVKESKSSCYESDFVIAEVNADTKLFGYNLGDDSNLEKAKQQALETGSFKLVDGEALLHGTTFWKDPWGNSFNTIGHTVMTKKVGPISPDCAKSPWSSCKDMEHDVTAIYKKCAPDARQGGDGGAEALDANWNAECGARAELQEEQSELGCKWRGPIFDKAMKPIWDLDRGSLLQVEDSTNRSSVSEAEQGPGGKARKSRDWEEKSRGVRKQSRAEEQRKKRAAIVNSQRGLPQIGLPQIPNFKVDWTNAPPVGPFGKISADEKLPITIVFSNSESTSRTIQLLFYVIPRYYNGKPVNGIRTRTKQHIARVQLGETGATEVRKTITVDAKADKTFVHTIENGLKSGSLSALSIDENVYLHFYFSVAVEDKTINYETKLGLSCPQCWQRSRLEVIREDADMEEVHADADEDAMEEGEDDGGDNMEVDK